MKVTLAKSLKLKNRFAEKISDVNRSIIRYNSVIEGQERPVDINELMMKREKLIDGIINLKTAINKANEPIQSTIYLLAELKGDVSFYSSIDTEQGKQLNPGMWGKDDNVYVKEVVLDYETVKGLKEQAQEEVDNNQDKLDKHNHSVEIDVDDELIKLLRG